MTKRIITTARVLPDGQPFKVVGRFGWALKCLVNAGEQGCTPINHPGPRWSAYVHRLRKDFGLVIETIHENHGGPFPGNHARYRLVTKVEIIPDDAADIGKVAA
ncbi:winged helix domain-containing protein [Rhizobium sp. KDH_Rht_773_N]